MAGDAVHSTKLRICKAVPFKQGHGCQVDAVGHVPDGVNAVHVGLGVFIHFDGPISFVQLYAHVLQPQVLNVWLAASCIHDLVARDLGSSFRRHHEAAICSFLNFGWIGVELHIDAHFLHFVCQMVTNVIIEASQEHITSIHQRHVCPVAFEDAGKLHRNVSTTDDHNPLGAFLEVEGLIAGDAQVFAGDVWDEWPSSDRHQNLVRADRLVGLSGAPVLFDRHRVLVLQTAPALDELHAGVHQHVLVNAVEAADLLVLVRHQRGPIKSNAIRHVPAIRLRVLHVVGVVGPVHHQLLGHTPHVHACPTHRRIVWRAMAHGRLQEGHFGSVRGRNTRGPHAP
mmetsp:Transcript_77333/g.129745  ORF Transcript_77333/g.129745 Transcript_77333/m.129745 type:complete len:340 (-) Transcript_77333:588-1607(-)